MIDIIGKRYWWFALSLLVIIPGIVAMVYSTVQIGSPLRLGIDFTGGTRLLLPFERGRSVGEEQIRQVFVAQGIPAGNVAVQRVGKSEENTFQVRTVFLTPEKDKQIRADLQGKLGLTEAGTSGEIVDPIIGKEVAERAAVAVALASLGILAYISFAFRQVPGSVRYGTCAVVALVHDVFVVTGVFSILGLLFDVEVDALFLTALLTVIGFSVHDTIVVFDRIRENMKKYVGEPFDRVVNHSIIQTLDRSINTTLTVLLTLTALFLFGGVTIRTFVGVLLLGIFSGTYSSIFNASPLLVVWEYGEIGAFFRRLRGQRQPA